MVVPPVVSSLLRHFKHDRHVTSLLVSSALHDGAASSSDYRRRVGRRVEQVRFDVGSRYGVPLVPCTTTAAFPTAVEVRDAVDLARRGGATGRVIGVGSRGAVELAKAVTAALDVPATILVPATPGAVLASASRHPLLYDVHEEGLYYDARTVPPAHDTVIVLDSPHHVTFATTTDDDAAARNKDLQTPPSARDAAYAVLAVCVDTARSSPESSELLHTTVDNALQALRLLDSQDITDNHNDDDDHPYRLLTTALLQAGSLSHPTSENTRRRSLPLALACGLLPPYYPHANLLTLTASLLPGMCQAYGDDSAAAAATTTAVVHKVQRMLQEQSGTNAPPSLAGMTEGTQHPNVATMLDRTNSNLLTLWEDDDDGVSWEDEHSDVLEEILHRSLNR